MKKKLNFSEDECDPCTESNGNELREELCQQESGGLLGGAEVEGTSLYRDTVNLEDKQRVFVAAV